MGETVLQSQVVAVDNIILCRYTLPVFGAPLSERGWLQLSSLLIQGLEAGSSDAPEIPRSAVKVSGRPGTIPCCFLCVVMSLKNITFFGAIGMLWHVQTDVRLPEGQKKNTMRVT